MYGEEGSELFSEEVSEELCELCNENIIAPAQASVKAMLSIMQSTNTAVFLRFAFTAITFFSDNCSIQNRQNCASSCSDELQ